MVGMLPEGNWIYARAESCDERCRSLAKEFRMRPATDSTIYRGTETFSASIGTISFSNC